MNTIIKRTIRELIRFINEYNIDNPDSKITKDRIVSILKDNDQYILIYE